MELGYKPVLVVVVAVVVKRTLLHVEPKIVSSEGSRVVNNQFDLPSGFMRLPNKGRVKPVWVVAKPIQVINQFNPSPLSPT